MRKLVLASLFLIAFPAWAGENTCIDSSGNFDAPTCDAGAFLNVNTAPQMSIDGATTATGWTALGNDTTGVETDLDAPIGGGSVEFDKVDGAANTVYGAVYKTLSSANFSGFTAESRLEWALNVSALTNISYAFIRLGTSASHYTEWRVGVADLTTGWQVLSVKIGEPTSAALTGNGWDYDDVDYICIGVAFSAQDKTLADVRINNIVAVKAQSPDQTVQVTTSASGLGKAEDAAHTSGDTLVAAGAVRNDGTAGVPSALAGTSGDYIPITTDAAGRLWVTGTKAEDTAAADTENLVGLGAVRDDALTANNGGSDADWTVVKNDNYGSLWTHPVTFSAALTDTATVDTNIYAAGDCLEAAAVALTGTAATAPFLGGKITDVVVTDLAKQSSNLDVVFFNADPGAVCGAINDAFDLADDDISKLVGVVHVTDHINLNDNSISQALNQNVRYVLASGTALYYAVIVQGTPTYAASDISIRVKVELD